MQQSFLFYTLISRTVNFRRTFQSAPVTRKIIRNPPAGNAFLTILFKGDFQMNQTTELVRRAASGDAHAFATLYSFIYKDLYRFSLYTLQNPQDAEDAVSEAVLDAFSGIGGLRDPEAFKSWMFAILSAKCKQKIRQYKNADSELSEDLAANDCSLSEQTAVRLAFQSLAPQDRLILSLHLFGGYTSQEIGEQLEMTAGTVRSRQSRALQKLQTLLG